MDGWLIFGFIFVVVGVPIFIIFVIPALLDRSEEASHRRFEEEIQEQKKEAERRSRELEENNRREELLKQLKEVERFNNEVSDLNNKGYYFEPSQQINDVAKIERMKEAILQKRGNVVEQFVCSYEKNASVEGCRFDIEKNRDFGIWNEENRRKDRGKFISIKTYGHLVIPYPIPVIEGFVIKSDEEWAALLIACAEKLHKNNNSMKFIVEVNYKTFSRDCKFVMNEVEIFDVPPEPESFI